MIGKTLGHYEITDELGKGGMGEVYRAHDSKLGREVAIKVLPQEFAQDAERVARLEREARMLAALNHPNIAAIYGLEQQDDTHFLVLELVEGDTLADRIKHGVIPVEESLKLAIQITEALEAAHEKGVIHRDLKPANIKVTPDGKVKVLDFGLAKAFSGEQGDVNLSNSPTLSMQATQQGVILGTAAYMSPEQAQGEEVNKRSDNWSFGIVLFEMLTGRQVFTGRTVSLVLADVLKTDPDWAQLPANLHPRLRLLLERLLEKDPKDRLSGISDARVEIQKVQADPDGARPQPPAAAPQESRAMIVPWVAAVVLAAIAGIAAWTLKPEATQPVSRWSHILPDGLDFRATARPVVALSPDGSRFVYNADGGLYLRSLDSPEARVIPGTEEALMNPVFSPDGEWLAYWSASDSQLKKIAVAGGAAVSLASVGGNPVGLSWDSEDTIVYFSSTGSGVWGVSADGGEPTLIIGPDEDAFGVLPQLVPEANVVLTTTPATAPGGISAAVYSIDTGESKVLFPGASVRYLDTGHLVYVVDQVLFGVPFDIGRLETTGSPVPLVEGVGPIQYSVSAAGSLAYVASGATEDVTPGILTWVNRTGEREPLEAPAMTYRHPRLSPDGTRVAVYTEEEGGERDIWIYDLDGRSQIQLLAGEGNNSRPIWTPDSERLTFTSDRDGTESIWWQLADGSAPAEQLTQAEEGGPPHWPDAWSPDGRTLAYTSDLPGAGDQYQWTVSLDEGTEPLQIAGGPGTAQAGGGDFSPDGLWIAYRQNAADTTNVELQPYPPTGASYLTASEGGSYPMWSRDGTELFYRRPTGGPVGGLLAVVDVSTDGAPRFTNERVLPITGIQVFFGNRDYDIAEDGERLIVIVPESEVEAAAPPRPQINVVLNWFEELTERVRPN